MTQVVDAEAVATISTVVGWVDNLIGKIQTLIGWIGKIHIPSIPIIGGNAGGTTGKTPPATFHPGVAGVEHIHIHVDGRQLAEVVRNRQRCFGRANAGRSIISPPRRTS